MALRAAILLYLVPTFLFIINVIYSWGDFALYLGLKQIFIFLAIDILIISCIICLIDTSSTSLTFKTFSSRDINLTVLVGSILICIFIIENISSFNLIDIAIFSEKYRNGLFKGSGFYTFIILRIAPLMIAFYIFENGLSKSIVIPIFFVVVFCMSLGFRVYLFPILLAPIMFYFKEGYFRLIFIYFLVVFTLLIVFKIFLDLGSSQERSLLSVALNPFLRIMPVFLIDSNLFLSESLLHCVMPVIHNFSNCDSALIKEIWLSGNPIINYGVPSAGYGNYSGIAYPLKIYFLNQFGFLGYLFVSVINFFIIMLLYFSLKSKSQLFRFFCFTIFIFFTAATIEDIFILRSSEYALFLCTIIYTFRRAFNWKNARDILLWTKIK